MTGWEAGGPLAAVQARAAELQAVIDAAPGNATARAAADELHALMDDVANVDELPDRAQRRADRAVRVLRRAVRGRRLSRRQAATLDRLIVVVVNEDAVLLALAGVAERRADGSRIGVSAGESRDPRPGPGAGELPAGTRASRGDSRARQRSGGGR